MKRYLPLALLLLALTAWDYNGNAQTSSAVNSGGLISQASWSLLSVDSQETSCYNGAATNAFDGNPATLWHTQFCGGSPPPPPHQISINLGASYNLTGFQYLPRQDGSACGWIKDYAFYVSSDGVNWGTAVATGTFNYGNLTTNCPGPGAGVPTAQQIAFPQATGQYIRLVALDELAGNPWTSIAELNVLGAPDYLPQTGWSLLSVDSQETSCYNGAAINGFDGNPATMWHTQFCTSSPPPPHQISIDLGASYNLTGFQYLPRQDGSACGWIKDYAFYVSSDGVNWGTAVATGTFNYGNLSRNCPGPGAGVPTAMQVAFPQTTGQYIRLVALDELNGHPWTSMAELNVLWSSGNGPPPSLAQVMVNPAMVVGGTGAQGTVILNGPAPAGGAVVNLTSSDPSTKVPATVTVPANAFSATFTITSTAVGTVTQVNISGSYNGSANASFTVNPGSVISQAGWSLLSVDSQETVCYNGAATNAFDGNPATLWHTQFCGSAPPTPHQISIYLGASYNLTGFQYLPRQDGSACGWIKDYAFYVGSDGVNWGTAVATGTFNYGNLSTNCPGPGAGVPTAQQIAFPQTTAKYIRLVALDELAGNPWISVAELRVMGSTISTYSISGTLSPPALGSGVPVALSGTASGTTATDSFGNFVFSGLVNGSYTLTPTMSGTIVIPTSQTVTVNSASTTGVNFAVSIPTWSISGTITPAANGAHTVVTLGGAASATSTADASGNYSFSGLAGGSYTVTPSLTGFTFSPASQAVIVSNANVTGVNFSTVTYTLSGTISGSGGNGAAVTLTQGATTVATVAANSSGVYTFGGLASGSYTVTPSLTGFTLSPASQAVIVSNANVAGVNFSTVTYTLSGTISGSAGNGATLTLGGAASATTTANTSGNYSFSGLGNGTYSVTPSKIGYAFSPAAQSETINSANVSNVNFTGNAVPIAVSISPAAVSLLTGGSQQFTAPVTNATNTTVTWTATGGTVSSSGLYTAPSASGSYTVKATSVADTTRSASATVTITTAGTVLLGDPNVETQVGSIPVGEAEAFQTTADASGTVQSLVVYLDSSSTASQLTVGLYADSSGHPGALLSHGSSTTPVAGAWNPILIPAATLAAKTPYWIAILGTTSGTLAFRHASPGTCSSEFNAQSSLTSLPASWTTGTVGTTCPASVFGDSTKVVFFDNFPGTTLSSYWTVISRHGEYDQNETECNIPSMVSVSNALTITTEAKNATCGDYFTSPSSWPYITGDIQWSNLNFTYGTVEIQAKFPSSNTSLWPATWLLGSNCQYTNPLTGNSGVTINGHTCPELGTSGYTEIDMTECYNSGGWCQFHVANPNFGTGNGCDAAYTVDTNFHTFTTVWSSSGVTQYMDGTSRSTCNQQLSRPMFLLIQTQTGGAGGTPNSSSLPAELVVNYVKVTQP